MRGGLFIVLGAAEMLPTRRAKPEICILQKGKGSSEAFVASRVRSRRMQRIIIALTNVANACRYKFLRRLKSKRDSKRDGDDRAQAEQGI
jgi:hypothetical protein